jgi:hypothetical protein
MVRKCHRAAVEDSYPTGSCSKRQIGCKKSPVQSTPCQVRTPVSHPKERGGFGWSSVPPLVDRLHQVAHVSWWLGPVAVAAGWPWCVYHQVAGVAGHRSHRRSCRRCHGRERQSPSREASTSFKGMNGCSVIDKWDTVSMLRITVVSTRQTYVTGQHGRGVGNICSEHRLAGRFAASCVVHDSSAVDRPVATRTSSSSTVVMRANSRSACPT